MENGDKQCANKLASSKASSFSIVKGQRDKQNYSFHNDILADLAWRFANISFDVTVLEVEPLEALPAETTRLSIRLGIGQSKLDY